MPAGQLSDSINIVNLSSSPNGSELNNFIPDSSSPVDQETSEGKMENKIEDSDKNDTNDDWIDILGSGHLKMKTIKSGEPNTRPQTNDLCEIRFKGFLDDGTMVENFESLKIQLGCHEVVQGIEMAVPLMNIGEEAKVIVGARFGYGTLGNLPLIPPDSTITYDLVLLKSEPEPELEQISFNERKVIANCKKERGNWWYSRQDATKAIQCYRKAINILDETIPFCSKEGENSVDYTEEQIRDVIEQKLVIYNNLAAAQLQIEAYDSASISVNRVLQCHPKNVKALFRKGKILTAKGQINEAVEVLRQALSLEPENNVIKMELTRCIKLQQTEKQHEKILYRKMFGHDKKNEKTLVDSKKKNISWPKMLGTAASATVIAALAFGVCYKFKNYSFL